MEFDEDLFEKYAMQAEIAHADAGPELVGWLDVDGIGNELGMNSTDSRQIATYLDQEGWAKVNFAGGSPKLRLTIQGFREIAKLRRPRWRQWIDKHPGILGAIAGATAGGIINGLFKMAEAWLAK